MNETEELDQILVEYLEDDVEELEKVAQPFSTFGGKYSVGKAVSRLIPEHTTYVEPFCGAAGVFFKKTPSKKEVLSDLNPVIIRTFRDIRDMTDEEYNALSKKNWKPSESVFEFQREYKPKGRVERLYKHIYIGYYGFRGIVSGKGNFKHSMEGRPGCGIVGKLPQIKERLEGTTLLLADYRGVIKKYNQSDAFFFIDPPYFSQRTKGVYGKTDEIDEATFWKTLGAIKGKYIVTINASFTRSLLPKNAIIKKYKVRYTRAKKVNRYEYFISNYPLEAHNIYFAKMEGPDEEEIDVGPEELKSSARYIPSEGRGFWLINQP